MVLAIILGFLVVLFIASYSLLKNTKVKDKETEERVNRNFVIVWSIIIVISVVGVFLYYFSWYELKLKFCT